MEQNSTKTNINWYPGHMAKTKRQIADDLRKAGKYFIDLGIKNVFITLDEDGIYYNNGIDEG